MKSISISIVITLAALVMGCNQNKQAIKQVEEAVEEAPQLSEEEMTFKGYQLGTVVQNEGAGEECEFLIRAGESQMLEAMDFPKEFQIDGLLVYVKYSYQRRPARCPNSQPVEILDIMKKKG